MLLRSTSAPILRPSSCIHRTSSEPEFTFRIPTSRPFSVNLSSSSALSDMEEKKMSMTSSANDARELLKPKKRLSWKGSSLILTQEPKDGEQEEEEERYGADQVCDEALPFQSVWSCSGLSEELVDEKCSVLVGGGTGSGGGGGGDGGRDGCGGWGQGSESLDGYYQRMIKAHPGDALLLGNYARFLKERDAEKAEEYCERAILAKRSDEPKDGDGDVLSLYGDLIWTTHKDGPRARSYFDQAVRSAPGDCYVLASYARFLWDAGEEEGDDDAGGGGRDPDREAEEEEGFNTSETCLSNCSTDHPRTNSNLNAA
ncbi:uncharacterized protein LOC115753741 isoform X2 [Rhodamnia argentea]|uniref:Uncharacterized protein LOC115753741 isoform X2 n=1 Tax=Rhodamnia argentea TaxID=178133 RepID=A0A8B8QPI2_9MYRT|nr:uncharacterized protein LOC115753741 isoform X2 [Rhodamnia argentea]